MQPTTVEIILLLVVCALWIGVGLLLCLYIESRPRWHKLYDRTGTLAQWLIVLLWPLALPLVMARHARAAR